MNVKRANLILLDMDRTTENIDTLISTNGKFIQFSAPGIKNVNSFKFLSWIIILILPLREYRVKNYRPFVSVKAKIGTYAVPKIAFR